MGKKGFTLIELMVVISIVAILSTIGLVIFQGAASKARDAQRKHDLTQLATALEIYYQQHDMYPAFPDVTTCPAADDITSRFYEAIKNYLVGVSDPTSYPKDPLTKQLYCYISSDGASYSLYAKLENYTTETGSIYSDETQFKNANQNFGITSDNIKLAAAPSNTDYSAPPVTIAPPPPPPPPASCPSSGLVGYWAMDETSGNLIDSSGNGGTGADTATSVVTGKFGNGRSFNGSSSKATIPTNSLYDITGPITISFWINSTMSDRNWILSKENNVSPYQGYDVGINSATGDHKISFWTGTTQTISNGSFANGTWTNVVITNDGTNTKYYFNGTLDSSFSQGSPNNAAGRPIYFGYEGTTRYYSGSADDVRIYNRVLSPTEVAALYSCTPSSTSGPLATGGTITQSGGYTIHTFTSSGTFTANSALNAQVLVVAGGGGGAWGAPGTFEGGGGGAGGFVSNDSVSVAAGTYTITVGTGGSGGAQSTAPSNGGNSSFGSLVTAIGGGGGGEYGVNGGAGSNGGSGGGAGTVGGGGSGTTSQGNNGGVGGQSSHDAGGGGGGAGSVGGNGSGGGSSSGGTGGSGLTSSITGLSVIYAGGADGKGQERVAADTELESVLPPILEALIK